MTTNAWDDMRRVREEEYFVKNEAGKLRQLHQKWESLQAERGTFIAKLNSLQKAHSPVSGAGMYKMNINGHAVLDCPMEGTVLLTYEALADILQTGSEASKQLWQLLFDKQP